jgi:L-ribulose-5-phosphate 3-epimerase
MNLFQSQSRRDFLKATAASAAGLTLTMTGASKLLAADKEPSFKISLAEWSLNRALKSKKLSNLDFPKTAKEDFGIDAVEYVNQFFMDKAKDQAYLNDLKQRTSDLGVANVLIMCDNPGQLGDPDEGKRIKAAEGHHPWVDAAKFLGCHSIRVNARSDTKLTSDEQAKLVADGLRRLSEYAAKSEINVIVENHGGLSSNGEWLVGVIKAVQLPNCGTLPDFGNFYDYDRYKGVAEMMPFAKGVSAKSYDFDAEGNETTIDYRKMMKIVLAAGYHGRVGIEYEGNKLSEPDGIKATKKLLDRIQTEMSA